MKRTGSFDLSKPCTQNSDITITAISKEISSTESAFQNEESKEPAWKCRYVVAVIGFLVVFLVNVSRVLIGVTIVAMVNQTAIIRHSKAKSESCMDLLPNSTGDVTTDGLIKTYGEFTWSPETQGYILGCYSAGQVIALIPSGMLTERYGCKWNLVGSIAISSLMTALIPPFSWWSANAVIVLQTLRGLTQGMTWPVVVVLFVNWVPKTERGPLYSAVQSANSLGPALGTIFAGYVTELTNWSYVFYSVGGPGFVLAAYIFFFIAENPKEHSSISKAELNYILSSQENTLSRRRPKLPWRQLLTSVPFYALIIAMFGRFWKYTVFSNVYSIFLGTILHYPIGQNGLFSAIPYLVSFLMSVITILISGHLEKKKVFSVDFLRKFWNFISALLFSGCLLGMYFAGCDRKLSVVFATLAMGSTGLGAAGAILVPQDMSPTFAGSLVSISYTAGWLAGIMVPVIVGYLTDGKQTLEQWNKVFFVSIGVVMSSGILFAIFGSAEIQPWNFVEEENKKTGEKQSKTNKDDETSRF